MHLRRNLAFGLIALVIIGVIVYSFLPQPRPVDGARVTIGPMQVTVQEEGKTRVIDRYVISAPLAGYVPRIVQKVGDSVERTKTLVQLEPVPSPALDARSRASASARVESARAALQANEEQALARKASAEQAQVEIALSARCRALD